MAGLNLHLGAGAQVGAPTVNGQAASTAAQAGFGQGFSQAGMPDSQAALYPNDPFGVALWVGVGALVLLVFIRYSLPA